MKSSNLIRLELRARYAGLMAWRIFGAQGGYKADPKRGRPLNSLAAKAREIADLRQQQAELWYQLSCLFPLGYGSEFTAGGRKVVAA